MFSSRLFNTRIKSANIQRSERWLAYFLAPALMATAISAASGTYLNVFYTDVLNLGNVAGGLFLALLPIISKIIAAAANVAMGRVIDSTRSRHGKARPWLLISGPLVVLSGILLFTVPNASLVTQIIWIIISYNLFFAFASTMYGMSHALMVPLSTRNTKQRDGLALVTSMGAGMIPGTLVSLGFPMIALPLMGVNQGMWITVMAALSALALPGVILEFYFTRERVTEESAGSASGSIVRSMKEQLKACLSSKYWVIIMVVTLLMQLSNSFSGISMIYYSNWVLGTYNDGITMTMINAVGQAPMGFGVFIMWPLCKKFGKRNITAVGFLLGAVGCAVCMLFPRSMGPVLGGLMIKSIGMLPSYVMSAMIADTLDHVEWKNGFRCDGLSASVISVITAVSSGIGIGLFNWGLSATGYIAPAASGGLISQGASVQNLFVWGFYGIPMAAFIAAVIPLLFYKADKKAAAITEGILARHKAEAEAAGIQYISPEEKTRLEQEELNRVAEEKRTQELKAKCAKKGLAFEEEEARYQARLAKKGKKPV
jgi:GPH family glycoside/pentoside/hexuronide:cation symporter